MRVLHVTNHFYPILGYQETFLARYHSERNTVMVITSDRHSKGIFRPNKAILKARIVGPGLHKEEGLDVLRLRTLIDSDTLTVQVLAGLERAVREFAPDIIIAHEVVTVNTMRIALLRRFLRNTRIVVDDHMVYSATRGGWTAVSYQLFRIMVSPVLQRLVDRFVAVAPETREFMHKIYGIPLKRISLIPLGVDLKLLGPDDALRAEYRLKLRFEASNVVFAYVGKLIPQKGVHLFVEAAIRLLEKDRTVRFMLVGGGRRTLQEEVAEENRRSPNG
jgi:glycosyltransferase involved in cell wall biosynthesis